MNIYKHYISITSQLPFCTAPIRIDSYSRCQFSCDYCFASARTGSGRDGKLSVGSSERLDSRLRRISEGEIRSALDEFLFQKIPIQLGGMSDPFPPIEKKEKATLGIISILSKHQYPFLISTKGDIIFEDEYLNILYRSNTFVRFSFSGAEYSLRRKIDRNVMPFESFLLLSGKLRQRGINFGVRLQPIIPGNESHAIEMIKRLSRSGVAHISAEFLKVPLSARKRFGSALQSSFGGDVVDFYQKRGASLNGNEYEIPRPYRKYWLDKMAIEARAIGSTFGYADNDLLLFSDGNGCCSGSDLYLKNSNIFRANTLGILRGALNARIEPKFEDIDRYWMPQGNIAQYLNSKTRITRAGLVETKWRAYAKAAWERTWGPYDPSFFARPDN